MEITKSILSVGVYDREINLFEGQYPVSNGMMYNSYLIKDEKIAVMDTVEASFADEWIQNIEKNLDGKEPDYLIIQHMEPDHSGSIKNFIEHFKNVKIVTSQKALPMIKNFYNVDLGERAIIVNDGDTLNLGKHNLTFFAAAMIHWPEVIMTYESSEKILFSADAFGKFGDSTLTDDWADEARRYYIGIVAKYGLQVSNLLKKLGSLNVEKICSLHGPVLTDNIGYYVDLYAKWATYQPETDGVAICYTTVYKNTENAAMLLRDELEKLGCEVEVYNLAQCDVHAAVAAAFKFKKLVLATTTYNADIFPFMRNYIAHLTSRNFQNRTVAFIENGSWAPMATKVMASLFEKSKNLNIATNNVTILSSLDDQSKAAILALANELAK